MGAEGAGDDGLGSGRLLKQSESAVVGNYQHYAASEYGYNGLVQSRYCPDAASFGSRTAGGIVRGFIQSRQLVRGEQ